MNQLAYFYVIFRSITVYETPMLDHSDKKIFASLSSRAGFK